MPTQGDAIPLANPPGARGLNRLERFLRIFCDVRPTEGASGMLLLLNIFLIITAYYFIKPLREGWLSITAIQGLTKIEIKAYSSLGQGLLLLVVVRLYGRLASRLTRRQLLVTVTLFSSSMQLLFWLFHPGHLPWSIPYLGIAFYLWVGIFNLTIVAQFWAFSADLYTGERGERLFPLIAVGASAGGACGSWISRQLVTIDGLDPFNLLLLSIIPLLLGLLLSLDVERRGTVAHASNAAEVRSREVAAPEPTGAFTLIWTHNYLLAVAILSLLLNWVNSNGENILYGFVQEHIGAQFVVLGQFDPQVLQQFVNTQTTLFFANFYFWVNLCGLLIQLLLVPRLLQYGGVVTILLFAPLIAIFSYSFMLLFTTLFIIKVVKIAENSSDYSLSNTARQVIWLPTSPTMTYKAKAATDTFFVRAGDGLAALTVFCGVEMLRLPLSGFIVFNVGLACCWGLVAWWVAQENGRLVKVCSQQGEKSIARACVLEP